MKRSVTYGYLFAPAVIGASPATLDLHAIPSFDITQLYAVWDITTQKLLYAAATPGFGASISNSPYTGTNNLLTLSAPTVGCSATDILAIYYDDGAQVSAAAAQLARLAQGGALVSSSNRLPVEVDAQSAGIALDATVASAVAVLGTIGNTPPTLPSSSTGILGILRLIESMTIGANASALNVTTATEIKSTPGRIAKIMVVVAGSGAGTVNDSATLGAVASTNLVANIPATLGLVLTLDWPCAAGIALTPGTGQTLAISYS